VDRVEKQGDLAERATHAPDCVPSTELRVLAELSEAQRSHASERFALLRRHLENGVPLAQVSREHKIPRRTLHRWLEAYRMCGLAGLVRKSRDDRGRRSLPIELEHVIEGFALRRPPMSRAPSIAKPLPWPVPTAGLSQVTAPCMT
jgi:putative transposase